MGIVDCTTQDWVASLLDPVSADAAFKEFCSHFYIHVLDLPAQALLQSGGNCSCISAITNEV